MSRLIDADVLKRHEQKIATQAWKMKVKASVETILNQFIDYIDHAPTVDAVPVRHGRWQWISSTYDRVPCEKRYWCSKCHHETITHDSEPWEKFCPNCGARMDGKDGDNHD